MTEGRWNDEGFWDWGHNLEGREKTRPEPTPEARAGLRAFLSAGGAVADDEVARSHLINTRLVSKAYFHKVRIAPETQKCAVWVTTRAVLSKLFPIYEMAS